MVERVSALRAEHEKLGAEFAEWNGMDVAATYAGTTIEQDHDATRNTAGLFDLTAFRKIWISGPDARAVVDKCLTRDISKLAPGKAMYAMVLNDEGGVCDDGIVFCHADDKYMWVIGSGTSGERIIEVAKGKDAKCEWDNELQVLSLQGPKSADVLAPHAEGGDLKALRPFNHANFKLFGRDVNISRTGYSGERGYEIYAKPEDAVHLWNEIIKAGKPHGAAPASFNSLNPIRVEAGLLFYPYDVGPDNSPWEVSAGFLVSESKSDYLGRDAALARKGKERFILRGISVPADAALWEGGEEVQKDGKKVGEVNIGDYSHRLRRALGYVFVDPNITAGTEVKVGDKTVTVEDLPFIDKARSAMRV